MNSNWRNRPTNIDYISKDIDVIVAIDESGTASLKGAIKANKNGGECSESERYFTVIACAIKTKNFTESRDIVMALKNKYWNDALFSYNGIDKRVCFHSREIRGKKEAFNCNVIDYDSFINDLSEMMAKIPMKIYASNIDKVKHIEQYRYPNKPYDLCMNFVLERILMAMGATESCIVVLESRGKKEDSELLEQIKRLIKDGNNYHEALFFQRIKGVYFNSKWCKMADNKLSYWELELADLCAYPISKYFKHGNKDQAFNTIERKFAGYPSYIGKGFKSFP